MSLTEHLRRFALWAALAGLVSGCAVGPNYRPPSAIALKVPAQFRAREPAAAGAADIARWWSAFNDPMLTYLVERGLAANLDIDAAGARLRQARASLRGARADLFPTLGASGSVSRTIGQDSRTSTIVTGGATGAPTSQTFTSGGDITLYRGGFDAAYQVDLFGGIRRSIEAARADLGSSEANLRNVQLTVASEVALNYLDARLAQARLAVARDTLAAQRDTVQIVGWRVQAGLVSSLDQEQARQLFAQTEASIPTLETGYVAAVNRLAVLLGEAPGAVTAMLAAPMPVPLAPAALDQAIPAEVIQRRPDVAAAERTLAAATARIGVATAALYPALRLTGSFNGSGTRVGDILDTGIGSLLAGITAPIFQGGRLRAAIEGQRAATDVALATYRTTVLVALEETENALTTLANAERRERSLIVADEASRAGLILARSQYRAGLIDFQALLESERSALTAQDSRAQARAQRATATVQLYKALGGGWQAAPLPATAKAGGAPTLVATRP